jgi:hypothetical protein
MIGGYRGRFRPVCGSWSGEKEDETFILSDPDSGDAVRCFSGWNLNNLDEHRTAVLMFKVKPQGPARLGMWFNGKVWEIYYTFDTSDSESVRSFHEVVLGKHLYGANNELCVESRETDGEIGQLEISDIVLFYHGQT